MTNTISPNSQPVLHRQPGQPQAPCVTPETLETVLQYLEIPVVTPKAVRHHKKEAERLAKPPTFFALRWLHAVLRTDEVKQLCLIIGALSVVTAVIYFLLGFTTWFLGSTPFLSERMSYSFLAILLAACCYLYVGLEKLLAGWEVTLPCKWFMVNSSHISSLALPPFAWQMAEQVQEGFPQARFRVQTLEQDTEKLDPLLEVCGPDDQWFVICIWDEFGKDITRSVIAGSMPQG